MFGRMRASSSSPLDSFEGPPPKIFKHDSLSIYETTLMKLKLGSQRPDLSPLHAELLETESDVGASSVSTCSMDSNSPPTLAESSCLPMDTDSSCESAADSKQQRSRNVSVLYLFSKYMKSPHGINLSASSSSSCSNCQSFGRTREQSEHECLSSLTSVCQI